MISMVGKGSLQNIADILYLRGIDIGIVQSDVLAYARRKQLYPGIDGPTPTLGTRALWIVSADVPDALVHSITRALWHEGNRRILDQGHPMGLKIRLETALQGILVPLHPGAESYYREAGQPIPEDISKNN